MTTSLLDRIATLVQVNLSDLLMESPDPQEATTHFLTEMEGGLAEAKDAIAAAIAREHQLERQLREARALSNKWDTKTDATLKAGDEEGARHALKRKLSYQRRAQDLEEELGKQRQVTVEMKAALRALQAKTEDVRHQRDDLTE